MCVRAKWSSVLSQPTMKPYWIRTETQQVDKSLRQSTTHNHTLFKCCSITKLIGFDFGLRKENSVTSSSFMNISNKGITRAETQAICVGSVCKWHLRTMAQWAYIPAPRHCGFSGWHITSRHLSDGHWGTAYSQTLTHTHKRSNMNPRMVRTSNPPLERDPGCAVKRGLFNVGVYIFLPRGSLKVSKHTATVFNLNFQKISFSLRCFADIKYVSFHCQNKYLLL